jgi:hypothetical protein
MKFLTSLSTNRIERQQYCLRSWLPYGTVAAVQSRKDIDLLAQDFPDVDFVATDLLGTSDGRHMDRARVAAIVSAGPGLLINSDIKIDTDRDTFEQDWLAMERQFNIGIRYDFSKVGKPKVCNRYGIDAFLITSEVMQVLPDLGFVLGTSVWDYWIVWHMVTSGFSIKAKTTKGLLHLRHKRGWSDVDTNYGLGVMWDRYRVSKQVLDVVIPALTGRVQ